MTRDDLETPALIIDLELMEANLERMAAFFREGPVKLRPHFKNHKCPDLAWRQLMPERSASRARRSEKRSA